MWCVEGNQNYMCKKIFRLDFLLRSYWQISRFKRNCPKYHTLQNHNFLFCTFQDLLPLPYKVCCRDMQGLATLSVLRVAYTSIKEWPTWLWIEKSPVDDRSKCNSCQYDGNGTFFGGQIWFLEMNWFSNVHIFKCPSWQSVPRGGWNIFQE